MPLSATSCGNYAGSFACTSTFVRDVGDGVKSAVLQWVGGGFIKGVKIQFKVESGVLRVKTVSGHYVSPSGNTFPYDFNTLPSSSQTLVGTETANGYGLKNFTANVAGADALIVSAAPEKVGEPDPAYGVVTGLAAGASRTVSCPAAWTNDSGTASAACTGWKLFDTNGVVVASGDTSSFTYVHPDPAVLRRLEWQWGRQYRADVEAGEGGTVSASVAWISDNQAATVTAIPDTGHHFWKWTGDVPYGQVFSPTLTLDHRRPASVKALFEADGTAGTKVFTGATAGKWSVDSNWTPAGVPTKDDAVFIRASVNVNLDCVANVASLVVSNDAYVSANFASGKITTRTRDAASLTAGGEYGIRSRGDVTLLGTAKIYLGGYGMATNYFEVGGDLSLAGTANELALYAGPCGPAGSKVDWFNGGMRATVGGRTTIAKGCSIYPYAHARSTTTDSEKVYATGAPVVLDLGDLNVASGGSISASSLGWGQRSSNPVAANASSNIGGGYGGKGGGPGYGPYGYALAPFYPGMRGGNNGAAGGGSIRIAARNVSLAGSLYANSSAAIGRQGSGGGIWLTCDSLNAAGATISAKSSIAAYNQSYGSYGSGGGGGRIAIGLGVTTWQIEDLIASGSTDDIATCTIPEMLGAAAPATLSVAGSTGGVRSAADDGADGTAVAYVNLPPSKVALFVTTDVEGPQDPGASPTLGVHLYDAGQSPNGFSFPATAAVIDADGSLRYACSGWTLTFADGTSVSGEGAVIANAPNLSKNATLVWHLASPEAKPLFSSIGDASATATTTWGAIGSTMSVTAAAGDEAFEFQYWLGDVPYSNRYDNPLVVPARGHFQATAFFGHRIGAAIRSVNADNRRDFFNAANWTGGVIPGTNDSAVIYSSGTKQMMQVPTFFAVKNLAVSNAYLLVNCSTGTDDNQSALSRDVGTPVNRNRHVVLDSARTEPFGIDVHGDLLLDKGGYVYIGGRNQNALTKVRIDGDCTLKSGYLLQWGGINHPTPAPTQAFYYPPAGGLAPYFKGYNTFDVAGDTVIKSGSWIVPMSDYRTGVSPWMTFSNLVVEAGGGFNGSHAGFCRGYALGSRLYHSCPGGAATPGTDRQDGGAHGGLGGSGYSKNTPITSIQTYGFENAPLYPGSPKYSWRDDSNNGGGGAIHIKADSLTLNGSIRATCGEDSVGKGGKGGGAVWVSVKSLEVGDNAFVSVAGGKGTGGGGGGRAAICVGLTDEQLESLAFSADHTAENVNITPLADFLGDRFSCAGGASPSYTPGQPGTGVYIVNTAGRKVLTIAGDPENIGDVVPPYGPLTLAQGTVTNVSAPETVFVADGNLSRRVCMGYTVSNAATGAVTSGPDRALQLTVDDDLFVTWHFTNLQHSVMVAAEGNGSIATNVLSDAASVWQGDATPYIFTAVPAEGQVFAGWTGNVPVDQRENATFAFETDKGRNFSAVFVTAAAGDKVWTGEGDGSSWYDDANWSPAGVPGPRTRVTIPAGFTVTAGYGIPVLAGSLSIASGSSLNVRTPSTFSTDVKPPSLATEADYYKAILRIGGSLVLDGTLTVGRKHSMSLSELSVGGDFEMGERGVLNAFAGYRLLYWNQTVGWDEGGGSVRVGGRMSLASGAWVYPWCNGLRGAPVVFDVGSLSVATNAGFNATAKGYTYTIYDSVLYCYCPGIMYENNYAGATFAALGGTSTSGHAPRATIYGSAVAPFVPGCCSRNDGGGTWTYGTGYSGGGGAIRIRSRGPVHLRGSLIADGQAGFWSQGGASGGAIWVTAPRFKMWPGAIIRALGGGTNSDNACGSGGRICIAEGLTDAQIASFIANGTANGKFTVNDLVADPAVKAELVQGVLSAAGGVKAEGSVQNGGNGSEIWITTPPPRTLIFLR